MKNKILCVAGASLLGLCVFLAVFTAYRYFRPVEPTYTLREALWVADREMKHVSPPNSPQSREVVDILRKKAGMETDKKAYQGYILYRAGLTTDDKPVEPLLISDFQPPELSDVRGTGINLPASSGNEFSGQLNPDVYFTMIRKPGSDLFYWNLSEGSSSMSAGTSDGTGVNRNERFTYLWIPESKTFWFATPRFVKGTTLNKGHLDSLSGWTSTTPGYQNAPNIPEVFKDRIAEMLQERGQGSEGNN